MNKEDRKIDGKEEIKIDDDYTPEKGSGASSNVGNKRVVKDNTKLIMAFVFLAVLALMGILKAHYGAILVVTAIESVLIYLIHKQSYENN